MGTQRTSPAASSSDAPSSLSSSSTSSSMVPEELDSCSRPTWQGTSPGFPRIEIADNVYTTTRLDSMHVQRHAPLTHRINHHIFSCTQVRQCICMPRGVNWTSEREWFLRRAAKGLPSENSESNRGRLGAGWALRAGELCTSSRISATSNRTAASPDSTAGASRGCKGGRQTIWVSYTSHGETQILPRWQVGQYCS